MTTLHQNQPPILVWELYEHDAIIRGQSCENVPFWEAKKRFEYYYEFKGKSAIYIVVSHEGAITRQAALDWCILHNSSRCTTRNVDLSTCQPTQVKK